MEEDVPGHHIKREYCETRPSYRKGKRKTSVRVFTVNTESKYLIVTEVPSPALESDLIKLFSAFGTLKHARELPDYPQEEFVKTYLIEFQDIQAAKTAKKYADEKYFYGGMLHVFYAPEYETVSDVREKIIYRRQSVTLRTKVLEKESKRVNKGKNSHATRKSNNSQTANITNVEVPKKKVNNPVSTEDLSQPNTTAQNNQSSSIMVNYPVVKQNPHNPIPCNNLGIPLFLLPPPPPSYPYQRNTFAEEESKSLLCVPENKDVKPINLQDSSKVIVKKASRLKTRTGYFHQKVVAAMNKNLTEFNKRDVNESTTLAKKVNLNFKPPPFRPRHIVMKNNSKDPDVS